MFELFLYLFVILRILKTTKAAAERIKCNLNITLNNKQSAFFWVQIGYTLLLLLIGILFHTDQSSHAFLQQF